MVSDSGWRKAQWAEDRSLTLGTHLGQAGDIQGQDIVWEPILASLFLFVCLCILINCFMTALLKLVTFIVA